MHNLSNKQLVLLAIVVVVLGVLLVFLSAWRSSKTSENSAGTQSTAARVAPPQPPLTASEMIAVQDPKGFQLLISYGASGFQPRTATVHAGDVVRFTNNSNGALWIASLAFGSSKLYPGASTCGTSELDSCEPLQPGQYWEFTFTQQGTWELVNNLDKSNSGTITVQ